LHVLQTRQSGSIGYFQDFGDW